MSQQERWVSASGGLRSRFRSPHSSGFPRSSRHRRSPAPPSSRPAYRRRAPGLRSRRSARLRSGPQFESRNGSAPGEFVASSYGLWRRWTRWEFWPTWALYMPLTPYLVWLALKHRSLTLFTAANPDIPAGGFIGESKFDILETRREWSAGCAVSARTCGSATRASDRHRSGIHGSHATYLSHCSQARSWTARIRS